MIYPRQAFLALLFMTFALAAHAQDVRYTVQVTGGSDGSVPSDGFRSGDIASVRVGLHNASDRTLEPGGLWVALPKPQGANPVGIPMTSSFDDVDRYLDENGADLSFSSGAAMYLYGIEQPLAPGANTFIRARLTVLSADNTLADYAHAVHLRNSFDRRIGTRVDELPPHAPRSEAERTGDDAEREDNTEDRRAPTALRNAPRPGQEGDAVEQHIDAMFGHLGAVRYACPELEDASTRAFCADIDLPFDRLRRSWDNYFDWVSEMPVTATALNSWSRDEEVYSRAFRVGDTTIVVAYLATGGRTGVIAVFADR